ncbi:hypothetical protein NX02_12160 [Sphingomonas sanxanigenens DSM 19645 = NX02]|uniref:Uncharacterized protein n=1 Tax=Sphingomonas sanxanigenens DSM 19645 = NX02 TaxID=1123269 RepID=W0A884_9SPHN|nr:hypothetical protein NX02_12160 [Sphingomonas sanxanigenens DSM 19645 = NX02]
MYARLHPRAGSILLTRLHPSFQMLAGMAKCSNRRQHVRQQALVRATMSVVGADGISQFIVVCDQQFRGTLQTVTSQFGAGRATGQVRLFHPRDLGVQRGRNI